jgi:hypothetical protein
MSIDLGSATTAKIHVKLNDDNNARFRLDSDDDWKSGPINWNAPSTTSTLTITFKLSSDVSGITSSSSHITISTKNDHTVIVTVTGAAGNDSFNLTKRDGSTEDPKIVVTPQGS